MNAARLIWCLGLCCVCLAACQPDREVAVRVFAAGEYPKKLSAWGLLLREDAALRLNRDVLPYRLVTPLFTDYAQKLRTVWMPPGQSMQYHSDGVFDLPVGSVISKTFYYPIGQGGDAVRVHTGGDFAFDGQALDLREVRLLETRLLVHQADGWVALPYVWDAQQADAVLSPAGALFDLRLQRAGESDQAFTYFVPDQNQCGGCHVSDHGSGRLQPIGWQARHLDRAGADTPGAENQLQAWQRSGRLHGLPASGRASGALYAGAEDAVSLAARRYLDINCAHCHSRIGAADTSGLFLDPATPTGVHLGLCKPPVAAGRGSGNLAHDIEPGAAQRSIVYHRMASTRAEEMMPELGRSLVHREGLALIADWINQMSGDCGS